jgi:hypothetical protein
MWLLAKLTQPGARNESISSWVLKSARGLKSEPSGFGSCSRSTLVGSGRNHPGGECSCSSASNETPVTIGVASLCVGAGGAWGVGIIQGWDDKIEAYTGPPAGADSAPAH